jgi:hypothetical protein
MDITQGGGHTVPRRTGRACVVINRFIFNTLQEKTRVKNRPVRVNIDCHGKAKLNSEYFTDARRCQIKEWITA